MRSRAEVEWEIDRLAQMSTRPRAVRQVADAMRWVLGLNPVPVSERLLPRLGAEWPLGGPAKDDKPK